LVFVHLGQLLNLVGSMDESQGWNQEQGQDRQNDQARENVGDGAVPKKPVPGGWEKGAHVFIQIVRRSDKGRAISGPRQDSGSKERKNDHKDSGIEIVQVKA
jgi:hypothetical protein